MTRVFLWGTLSLLTGLSVSPLFAQSRSAIVISQIYGGGGNSGASLRNDFVELFNRGAESVDLTGWTVQYASARGSSWDRTALSGVLAPGQYYLVQEARGSGGTQGLPAPDASGSIALSATSGKVALVSSDLRLTGSSPAQRTTWRLRGFSFSSTASPPGPRRQLFPIRGPGIRPRWLTAHTRYRPLRAMRLETARSRQP